MNRNVSHKAASAELQGLSHMSSTVPTSRLHSVAEISSMNNILRLGLQRILHLRI